MQSANAGLAPKEKVDFLGAQVREHIWHAEGTFCKAGQRPIRRPMRRSLHSGSLGSKADLLTLCLAR